jgi:GR25 family glycosyltransferase involved in LPS biosynthesis
MHILNEFFDKIFVISIPRNRDRLKSFLESFDGVDVEIFEGIDGKNLFPELEATYFFPDSFYSDFNVNPSRGKMWNKGQLGCALSNLAVQKAIIDRKILKALILEDDSILLKNRIPFFQKSLYELPIDWELFYLGYNPLSKYSSKKLSRLLLKFKYWLNPRVLEGKSSGKKGKSFFAKGYSKNLVIPGMYYGTHAYALTYEGARKIVEIDTPLSYGFDTTLMHACYHRLVKAYALKTPIIIPNNNYETSLIN